SSYPRSTLFPYTTLFRSVLTRMLYLLFDMRCLKGNILQCQRLLNNLPTIELSDIDVAPNENLPTETSIKGVGRFDIFLTANYQRSEEHTSELQSQSNLVC